MAIGAVVCAALGALCVVYGLTVLATGSGTLFFAVWLLVGALLVGLAVCLRLGLLRRLPAGVKVGGGVAACALAVALVAACACVASGFGAQGEDDLDYLVILGAQVREDGPSTVLRHRLDAAYDYLAENEGTVCIVSGGQGANEPWSEAQDMADYLVACGIAAPSEAWYLPNNVLRECLGLAKDLLAGNI